MTVLITGAGRIGTHTARALLDQGVGVLLFDPEPNLAYIERIVGKDRKLFRVERGDVRDLSRIVDLMLRVGVTRILHTAAMQGPRADENPAAAFQTNVVGTLNVIEAARIRGLSRIVIVSEAVPYGESAADRRAAGFQRALQTNGMAAAFHAMSELLALAYHQLEGVNAIVCRPCAVYGFGRSDGEFADDVRFEALVQEAIRVNGGGTVAVDLPTCERVYVKDVALGIREAIFVERPSTRSYDLGSGEIVGPRLVARTLADLVPGVTATPAGDDTTDAAIVDTSPAEQDLGYRPQWTLEQALKDYLEELRLAGPSR